MKKATRFRTERDSIGSKKVPADAYHGIFTQRARENFPISGWRPARELIESIIEVKLAAARANAELGVLDARCARAIIRAAREALRGRFDGEFALDVFTAGAGTPFNMNVNEVLANRANEILGGRKGEYSPVHPNDHVNLSQSSNDVIPTAIRLMALKLAAGLIDGAGLVARECEAKARRFRGLLKSARTHLQDAVPITLGQELAAYAVSVRKSISRIRAATASVRRLGIGATAAGTGINSHPRYARLVVRRLRESTGLDLGRARDLVEATHSMADLLELGHAVEEYAIELGRIANDLRLLSSGPATGLDEVRLPEVEPGSSIMPGKVNPSVPEMVNMVCFQVLGCMEAVRHAAAGGQLELNVFTPAIAFNLGTSLAILARASSVLARKCLAGLDANLVSCRRHAEGSAGIATALTPAIGYARAAELVKRALREGASVREVLARDSGLGERELRRLLDPAVVTRPNLRASRRGQRSRG
jgi:aspartate ammonia-lyase